MERIRGVNLGNWLVLERWMGPSPLTSVQVADDHDLVTSRGKEELAPLLTAHWEGYVTEETFDELGDAGVNLVRIPVPYHLFGTEHHLPCVDYLDRALDWARTRGISVLIDLHTVPYGQNGFDNGGYVGMCAWHRHEGRIEETLDLLERIARRYAHDPALWGLEPLNEPASEGVFRTMATRERVSHGERVRASAPIPRPVLRLFYERFCGRVGPILGRDAKLVLHDQFSLLSWNRFLSGTGHENVWLDTHCYLNFSEFGFRRYDLREYLRVLRLMRWRIRRASRFHHVLVGEWSLATHSPLLAGLDDAGRRRWYQALARAQLSAWDVSGGGCYWSWRVEDETRRAWSFVDCVREGWLDLRG